MLAPTHLRHDRGRQTRRIPPWGQASQDCRCRGCAMGKRRGREYTVGRYRLGWLYDPNERRHEACAVWSTEENPRHRHRLGVFTEVEARVELDKFARRLNVLQATGSQTIADL